MSVLKHYFDKSVNQASPVQVDHDRVVNRDEHGNEFITYVPVDYPKIQLSHGLVSDWSLDSLLKAGINPDFPIRTGNPTRLEGVSVVESAAAIADEILSEQSVESNEE